MPLTVRNNGSGPTNVIQAAWFNDYYNLLTGVMQDQPVTIKNNLSLQPLSAGPTVAPTGAIQAGAGMGIGAYKYAYTWVNDARGSLYGESLPSPLLTVTTTTGNQQVNLTSIPDGPTGTNGGKNLYRTAVGATQLQLLQSLSPGVTTFIDTLADGSLDGNAPTSTTFGGSLAFINSVGGLVARIANDGALLLSGAPTIYNGSVAGTATVTAPVWGPAIKVLVINFTNYNSAVINNFSLPTTVNRAWFSLMAQTGGGITFKSGGVTQNVPILSSFSGAGGGFTTQPQCGAGGIGNTGGVTIDTISISTTGGLAMNGFFVMIGT